MATVFKEVQYNLMTLIQNIDMGAIGLPDIQRPFVWEDTKVRDLFDSMYKGYPVGYLLFWENAHQDNVRTIGGDDRQLVPNLLIVDGQQRLTSLYAVLKGKEVVRENYTKERIIIAFHPLKEVFEIPDAAIKKSPEYIHDISDLWRSENVIRFTNDFIAKLKEHREISADEEVRIQNAIGQLHNILNFPFSALSLSSRASEEQVAEVFVRINSKGSKLNMSDFILTLMSVFWDDGRSILEDFCRHARKLPESAEPSAFNHIFQPDPSEVLRVAVGYGFRRARLQYVYSILRGKDLETGEFDDERRIRQFDVLKEAQEKTLNLNNWHEFLKAVRLAGYTRRDYISSRIGIVYAYVMFLVGKYEFNVERDALRAVIARWFFFTSLTGRYTGSSETQMEADLGHIRSAKTAEDFIEALNKVMTSSLTSDYWDITLPDGELATSSPRSPALFAYYAALHIHDAYGLFSGLKVASLLEAGLHEKRSALERHHLFPKAYLERKGVKDQKERNQLANYALVEWGDNDDISDEAPNEYLPRYLVRYKTPDEKQQAYYWHALPDSWEEMTYPEFLEARRKMMSQVIKDAFVRLK
jgi:hypothetical protein